MASFDIEEFRSVAADIERYLGWLKGNELTHEWLEANRFDVPQTSTDDGPADFWLFTSTVPEGEFNVTFRNVRVSLPPTAHEEWRQGVQKIWETGAPWADGTGEYLYSLSMDLARPNADALHAAVVAVQQASHVLQAAVPAGWLPLDTNSWTGESSDAFQGTMLGFNAVVNDKYLAYWLHSETIFAAACAIVVQFQGGLIPFLTAMRDGLREQLIGWVAYGGPPESNEIDAKVVDGAKLALKIISKVPAIGKIVGEVQSVAEITTGILGLFMEAPPKLSEKFVMRTSDDIYIELTTTLTDAYTRGAQTALDTLRAERSSSILNAQQSVDPWFTQRFPHANDEPWTHDKED